AIVPAYDVLSYSSGAHERRGVGADALGDERVHITAERRPVDGILDVTLLREHHRFHRVGERTHRVTFAHHLEGHSLPNVALAPAILNERFIRPAEHVDESRRNREPARVD